MATTLPDATANLAGVLASEFFTSLCGFYLHPSPQTSNTSYLHEPDLKGFGSFLLNIRKSKKFLGIFLTVII